MTTMTDLSGQGPDGNSVFTEEPENGQPQEKLSTPSVFQKSVSETPRSSSKKAEIDFLDCSNPDAKKSTHDDYCDPNSTEKSRGLTGKAREIACSIRTENTQDSNTIGEPFFCALERLGIQNQNPNYDYTCYGLFHSSCLINKTKPNSASDKKPSPVNSVCSCRTRYFLKQFKSVTAPVVTSLSKSNCNIQYECICNPNKSFDFLSQVSTEQAEALIETMNATDEFSTSAFRIQCQSILPRESGDLGSCYLKTEAFGFEKKLDCTHPESDEKLYKQKTVEDDARSSIITKEMATPQSTTHLLQPKAPYVQNNHHLGVTSNGLLGTAVHDIGMSVFLLGLIAVLFYALFRWRRK